MATKVHNNKINVRDATGRKIVLIGVANCKACKKRCRKCHYPFSVSTAIDEANFCSLSCEDEYFGRM